MKQKHCTEKIVNLRLSIEVNDKSRHIGLFAGNGE